MQVNTTTAIRNCRWTILGLLGVFLALLMAFRLTAAESDAPMDRQSLYSATDAVQHFLESHGKQVEFFAILEKLEEFGEDPDGLGAKLNDVVRRHGLNGVGFTDWTLSELKSAQLPLILRVRPAIDAVGADHFVVLHSVSDDTVTVYAGRSQTVQLPLYGLLSLWDGSGLSLNTNTASDQAMASPLQERTRTATLWIAVLGALVYVSSFIRKVAFGRTQMVFLIALQSVCVLLGAGVLSGIVLMTTRGGPAIATAYGVSTYHSKVLIDFRSPTTPIESIEITDLTADQLKAKLAEGGILFVDARTQAEFDTSHIKDALCLPEFNESKIRLRLAGIAHDQPLVVYCASETCPRGRAAAGALTRAGFTAVMHYPQGWADLQKWKEITIVSGKPTE